MINKDDEIIELTEKEVIDLINKESQKVLGITGLELINKFKKGEFEDIGDIMHIIIIAGTLPDNSPYNV